MSTRYTDARHAKRTTIARTRISAIAKHVVTRSKGYMILARYGLGFLIGALLTLLYMPQGTTTGYTANEQRMMNILMTNRETRALERRIITELLNEQYDPSKVIRRYDFDADSDGWYFVQEEKP